MDSTPNVDHHYSIQVTDTYKHIHCAQYNTTIYWITIIIHWYSKVQSLIENTTPVDLSLIKRTTTKDLKRFVLIII